MWKSTLFNVVLFFAVTYIGVQNDVTPLVLALVFAGLHHVLSRMVLTEGFENGWKPDSRNSECPEGSVRARNGLDCVLPTDIYGL